MSPEQARGKLVDKRTDIWAFGCVLFEMLSGKMAFEGDTVTDTIAAILERDPDWSTLPADTPRAVRRLMQRCLEKDPKKRLRDIGDARVEIDQIIQSPNEDIDADIAVHQSRTWRRRARLAIAGGAVAALSAAGLTVFALSRDSARGGRQSRRPDDGRSARKSENWSRVQLEGRALPGRDASGVHAACPARSTFDGWTASRTSRSRSRSRSASGVPRSSHPTARRFPSSRAIRVFAWARPFLKASLAGGAPTRLFDYDSFHRGDWAPDGWIYWTSSYPGGIVRIRDSGGAIEPVTEVDAKKGERSHRFADLLPGGRAIIYTAAFEGISSYNDARIELWDLNTRQKKTLIEGGTSAVYSPSGHLVYARHGKLFAAAFDLQRREVTGPPIEGTRRRDDEREHRRRALQPVRTRRPGLRSRRSGWREPDARVGRPIRESRAAPAAAGLVPVSANLTRRSLAGRGDRGTQSRLLLLRFRPHGSQQGDDRWNESRPCLEPRRQAGRVQVLAGRRHDDVADACGSKCCPDTSRSIRDASESGVVLPRWKVPLLRPEGSADAG